MSAEEIQQLDCVFLYENVSVLCVCVCVCAIPIPFMDVPSAFTD